MKRSEKYSIKFAVFSIIFICILVCTSCVSVKTQVRNITIWGTSPDDSLELGEFDVVSTSSIGKTKVYEVLKSDADKFIEMMNKSECFVTDFTLKECYLYKYYLSDGFSDGDECKLFYFSGNYWVARQVNVKYFYFSYLPAFSSIRQTDSGIKFLSYIPSAILASDIAGETAIEPYKVLYSWDELKKFFPDAQFDDTNKRIYLAAKSYVEGEGLTYIIYDETSSTITLSNYWEAAK